MAPDEVHPSPLLPTIPIASPDAVACHHAVPPLTRMFCAVTPPSSVAGQERHNGGDLSRPTEPTERAHRLQASQELLALAGPIGFGLRSAWADRVDGDPTRPELLGQDMGELLDSAFGRVVDRVSREHERRGGTGERDNPALVCQVFPGELQPVEHAL